MKKLLSLLSVLTISGSAIQTTIAASPYEYKVVSKQNIDKNIKFTSLKRTKRQNIFSFPTTMYTFTKNEYGRSKGDIYFGTTNGLYLRKAGESNANKINGIDGEIKLIQPYIDDIIFLSEKGKIYKIDNEDGTIYNFILNSNEVIKNSNLKNIDNNGDLTLLNELNYLNPNLDISQLYVTAETITSATIKVKNNTNKYFGEKKIYYTINDQQNKVINLEELIKKAIFFKFRDDNPNLIFKEIKNINTSNLIYSNVIASKSIEPIYSKNNKSICFGTTTLFHNLPEKQNMKTPSCKYIKETVISTQITKGLDKKETNSQTTDMKHNWSFELGVNVHGDAGVWPFGKVSTDINTKVGTGREYGSSETKTLSNTFNFSDSKTNQYKESSEVELPSQEIEVNPNQKIKVTASLDEVTAQVTLNLKQNIYGQINTIILLTDNSTYSFNFSIKEAMQKLQEFGILPEEIKINIDDSITFNGAANRSLKQGFDGNIEFHEVKN